MVFFLFFFSVWLWAWKFHLQYFWVEWFRWSDDFDCFERISTDRTHSICYDLIASMFNIYERKVEGDKLVIYTDADTHIKTNKCNNCWRKEKMLLSCQLNHAHKPFANFNFQFVRCLLLFLPCVCVYMVRVFAFLLLNVHSIVDLNEDPNRQSCFCCHFFCAAFDS